MKRLMTLLTAGMLGACSAVSAANEKLRAPEDKPNIIFIMADDLGWQDVGYMAERSQSAHTDNPEPRMCFEIMENRGDAVRVDRHA